MMLAHEMFKQNSKTITMKVGEVIPYQQIEQLPLGKAQKVKLIKRHLYRLTKKKNKKQIFEIEKMIAHP
jgi:hypothetical protein